jgi:hypothetical protein
MPEEYPKEQLWQLYEALPEELKDAIFSEKTAEAIYNVCQKNGLEKEMPQVAKYAGYVLLGLLTPDEFQNTLQEELKLKNDAAKKVALEISRFVFFPVKGSLEALYKIEIEKPVLPEKESAPEEKPAEKRGKDAYRESLE